MQDKEIAYVRTSDLLADSRTIIESTRNCAYAAVNVALMQRNWLLGKRIAEEELNSVGRAQYGEQVIASLARQLTELYGNSLDASNLYKFLAFYKAFPILDSLRPKSGNILSWTHYRILLQVYDSTVRQWYLDEAASQTWSSRTLQGSIQRKLTGILRPMQIHRPLPVVKNKTHKLLI